MVQRMIGHHRQILEDSDVVQRLKSMLYGQSEGARLASIQCLSQLILKPEGEAEHVADQTDVHDMDVEPWERHLIEARNILSEQPGIWIRTLYNLLDSNDQSKETLGTSCISRLVKIGMCSSCVTPPVESRCLVSVRDGFLKNDGASSILTRMPDK